MNSIRLRPVQTEEILLAKKSMYSVGEKCQARWSDSRKFPATIKKILDDSK